MNMKISRKIALNCQEEYYFHKSKFLKKNLDK